MNIPEVKLGIAAVSRDCFPIALSRQRRKNIGAAYGPRHRGEFKYLGVQNIVCNQPKSLSYATENSWR